MSARRGGRLPPSLLTTAVAADPSGGASFVSAWLALWPTLAAALGTVPIVLTAHAAAAEAAAWTAIATTCLLLLLRRDARET